MSAPRFPFASASVSTDRVTRGRGEAVCVLFGPVVSKIGVGFQTVLFGMQAACLTTLRGFGRSSRERSPEYALPSAEKATQGCGCFSLPYFLPFVVFHSVSPNFFYGFFFSCHAWVSIFTRIRLSCFRYNLSWFSFMSRFVLMVLLLPFSFFAKDCLLFVAFAYKHLESTRASADNLSSFLHFACSFMKKSTKV